MPVARRIRPGDIVPLPAAEDRVTSRSLPIAVTVVQVRIRDVGTSWRNRLAYVGPVIGRKKSVSPNVACGQIARDSARLGLALDHDDAVDAALAQARAQRRGRRARRRRSGHPVPPSDGGALKELWRERLDRRCAAESLAAPHHGARPAFQPAKRARQRSAHRAQSGFPSPSPIRNGTPRPSGRVVRKAAAMKR